MILDNQTVMVTGGTGSFGNAFVEHVLANYKPNKIIIYSRDEFKQFMMAEKFKNHPALRFFIGDIRDAERLERAMAGVDIVFHAAAMKQVVASEYNPTECIHTNILGAENLIQVAIDKGVKRVVALSTDKAVKPVNLYGSTKACAEKLFIAGNHLSGAHGTRFANVRYGNVIASRGSVIPLFKRQRETGVLTITHPDMTRYWLRIEQGIEFIIMCSQIMHGGETFVMKVPSMKITDLATAIAPECRHDYVGIRPGEKLHETMLSVEESGNALEFDKYYVIKPMIHLWDTSDYTSYAGVEGIPVENGFSYSSDSNKVWLDVDDILKLIDETDVVHG